MPNPKYEFYQTESSVVISILEKSIDAASILIETTEKQLIVQFNVSQISEPKELRLNLAHDIQAGVFEKKVYPTRLEIKLRKKDGIQWNQFEGSDPLAELKRPSEALSTASSGEAPKAPAAAAAAATSEARSYPSAKHTDWDRVARGLDEDEKPEGEQALQALFQKIYSEGNDETKRAMMKSFQESCGTVLSTNWNDIGPKSTEVKPPDGMEYKRWDK